MATVGDIEQAISRVERFRVHLVDAGGRNYRSDRPLGNIAYSYLNAAKGTSTVAEWRRTRFADLRCEGDVEVLFADGLIAHGNVLLANVRTSY